MVGCMQLFTLLPYPPSGGTGHVWEPEVALCQPVVAQVHIYHVVCGCVVSVP